MDVLQEQIQQATKKEVKKTKSTNSRVTSPFVKEVLNFAMPLKLKKHVIEPYHGKTSPRENVEMYVMTMQLYGVPD